MNKCETCKFSEYDFDEIKQMNICVDCVKGFREIFESDKECPEYEPMVNHCQRCGKEVEYGIDLCEKCLYEAQVELEEFNRLYEPSYNPEDGSM